MRYLGANCRGHLSDRGGRSRAIALIAVASASGGHHADSGEPRWRLFDERVPSCVLLVARVATLRRGPGVV
jgi:hypothetical protein